MKPTPPKSKKLRLLLGAVLFGVLAIALCNLIVEQTTATRVFGDIQSLPHNEVALVLGCVPKLADGRDNLYFRYRIEAAASLYHAGKVKYLLLSGDNGRSTYDEPTAMKQALAAKGVLENRIYLDYAGFRTLDSVVRAKKVFGQKRLTIVSQRFHNHRAIYIARQYDMDAVGFNAPDVHGAGGLKTTLREFIARAVTVLDVHVLRRGPKFLGDPIHIGAELEEKKEAVRKAQG